ncbi:MAG: hypothetical protein H6607_04515 [Flavobacteriales bacterium]|nr:hypothetical protein [Flavobacteriales bacterium]
MSDNQKTNVGAEKQAFSINGFLEKNSKMMMIVGGALVLVCAAWWYVADVYKPKKEKAANSALFFPQANLRNDSIELALNGDGENMGLIEVAKKYSGTLAGQQAALHVARIYMNQEKYKEAIEYIDKVDFDDEILAATVIGLKGDCYVEMDDVKKGAEYFMKAANKRDNLFTTPYHLQKAARAYMFLNDSKSALKALERIKEDYNKTYYAADIDKEIEMAKAGMIDNK